MLELLQSFPPERLAAFLAAAIVLNLTPGSDVVFATACGLRGGARAGAAAGLGVGLGALWHVGLAAAGLSALIAAYPGALGVIRWLGGGYLLYLAWRSWFTSPALMAGRGEAALSRVIWRGFVTNALNPKVALFVLAFLPQFTDPALGPFWQQILLLGAMVTFTGTAITSGYGALAGRLGVALGTRMAVLNKIASLLFAGLALRMLWI